MSTHTVDAYLRRIRAKLNITNTAELTRMAIALGL
ncbi:LuxR C-terminal-related transcriptional regulator [Streptomyces sp. NPDC052727]